jgi:hypothetical protein
MAFIRHLMVILLVICSPIRAQQIAYTSGSDFTSNQFRVQVSIGQVFNSFQLAKPLIDEGVFSILAELLELENFEQNDDLIHVSPNPFSDVLMIEAQAYPWKVALGEIYTNQGVFVESLVLTEPSSRYSLRHLPQGVYFLRLYVPGRTNFIHKIIKQN